MDSPRLPRRDALRRVGAAGLVLGTAGVLTRLGYDRGGLDLAKSTVKAQTRDYREANPPADLPQILSPDPAILRVVQQQVRQLGALLHQMHSGESGTLFHEPGNTQHLAQGDSGVVEAQRLIEVAHQQVTLHPGLPVLWPALGHIHRAHYRFSNATDRAR